MIHEYLLILYTARTFSFELDWHIKQGAAKVHFKIYYVKFDMCRSCSLHDGFRQPSQHFWLIGQRTSIRESKSILWFGELVYTVSSYHESKNQIQRSRSCLSASCASNTEAFVWTIQMDAFISILRRLLNMEYFLTLTFFLYTLRLCTLNAFVFGSTVTSTINSNAREWIAY